MMVSVCHQCYRDDERGLSHNCHQQHYINAFEHINEYAYYMVYHTPNMRHKEKQHCLEYGVVVYIYRPHYIVKMIFTEDQWHHDADKHHDASMLIHILIIYIFHATYMKIIILMLMYHIRPKQPVKEEERDKDEGDLPFPIHEVGTN